MRRVAEYQAHANECRKIAARMARPEDKDLLEQLAQAWEKVAKLRERHITDGDDG
jgi:Skp family chaperone for outer membrane proteins